MSERMERILEVRDLSVAYATPRGAVRALAHVDLIVPRGEIVGIVGESGCGKTTLISTVLRLLPGNAAVTSGSIRFEGREVLEMGEAELRRLRGGASPKLMPPFRNRFRATESDTEPLVFMPTRRPSAS